MELRIDTVRCAGHGVCEALRPDIFEVGDDGKAHLLVDELDEADRSGVQDAVNQCPEQALILLG
jgi:ferredoxin